MFLSLVALVIRTDSDLCVLDAKLHHLRSASYFALKASSAAAQQLFVSDCDEEWLQGCLSPFLWGIEGNRLPTSLPEGFNVELKLDIF